MNLADVDVQPVRRRKGIRGWLSWRQLATRTGLSWHWAALRIQLSQAFASFRIPRPQAITAMPWSLLAWSILPGMGQVKAGRRQLGWLLLSVWIAGLVLATIGFGSDAGAMGYAIMLSVHCTAIGLVIAPALLYHHFLARIFCGVAILICLHLLVYGLPRYFIAEHVSTVQVNQAIWPACIANGDVLACRVRFDRNDLQRGQMVAYELRGGLGVDRIVGLPGDRLTIHDGAVQINGAAPSPGNGPLAAPVKWRAVAEITCGPDEVLIVPSLLEIGTHGNITPEVFNAFARQSIRVKKSQITGPIFWRIGPLGRFGRLQ